MALFAIAVLLLPACGSGGGGSGGTSGMDGEEPDDTPPAELDVFEQIEAVATSYQIPTSSHRSLIDAVLDGGNTRCFSGENITTAEDLRAEYTEQQDDQICKLEDSTGSYLSVAQAGRGSRLCRELPGIGHFDLAIR